MDFWSFLLIKLLHRSFRITIANFYPTLLKLSNSIGVNTINNKLCNKIAKETKETKATKATKVTKTTKATKTTNNPNNMNNMNNNHNNNNNNKLRNKTNKKCLCMFKILTLWHPNKKSYIFSNKDIHQHSPSNLFKIRILDWTKDMDL